MVHGWPVGHTHKHLKHEVVYNLIENREDYATKLQFHLDKQDMTYMDAVLEINKKYGDEQIPLALGDFILAAISLTIKIPIYVIYPTVQHTKNVDDCPVTKFIPNIEYLFWKDANRAKTKSLDLIVVVYNGLDYYAPTVPKEIAHMMRNCTRASTHIKDAVSLIDKIVLDLPPSTAHDSLTKSLKFMRAANLHLEGTSLTTGTAVSTGMPFEVPILKTATAASVAKLVHKRAAASLGEAPPEKKRGETDDSFASRKQKYREAVSKTVAQNTKMAPFQCSCSNIYTSMKELLDHQANAHPDPKTWKCAHCPSVSNSKGHCWKHARHHLGKWYFYCNVKYTDKKDEDESGQPKKKTCEKGFDEEIGVEFHRETSQNMQHAILARINMAHQLNGVIRRGVAIHVGQPK